MHTATRLALPLVERARRINPGAHLCCFGLYAAMNRELLLGLGVQTLLSGEFEAGLLALHERLAGGEPPREEVSVSVVRQRFLAPWTTLDGYLELLRLLAAHGLVEHVAPIQLAIRLLIPAGSRLLELPAVRQLVGRFDPIALCHPWEHPDPRVDALQRALLGRVRQDEPRAAFFAAAWRMAHEHAAHAAVPPLPDAGPPAFVPHLTEPWYC
jgi:hypothetical protein